MIKNIFKNIIIILFLLGVNQSVLAKPVPPGSGEGDVPANILILLDNSKSMKNNKIGAGITSISAATIDGSSNKILASYHTDRGGLFKFNSSGDPVSFEGINDAGESYSTDTWFPSATTDLTCDYKLTKDGLTGAFSLPTHRRTHNVTYQTGVSMGGTNINENLIFFLMWANQENSYIVGLNETTLQCRIAIQQSDHSNTRSFDFATKDGALILTALGTGTDNGDRETIFTSCNMNDSICEQQAIYGKGGSKSAMGEDAWGSWRVGLDSDASYFYMANGRGIRGYQLDNNEVPMPINQFMRDKNCPGKKSGLKNKVQDIVEFDVSSTDDDIFFAGSKKRRYLQKIQFTGSTCRVVGATTIGTKGGSANIAAAGGLAHAQVIFTGELLGVEVIGNKVLVSHGSYVDEFDASKITSTLRDTAWQNQIGGGAMTRWDGAKKAIASVLSDSTLTSGANFGFGWWSAGENNRVGWYCDRNGTNCSYWTGWDYTNNRHKECVTNRTNSCLAVPIGPEGATDAINLLNTIPIRAGTDSHAWSQLAHGYFLDDAPNGDIKMYDAASTCQLNYVIVISDGMMRNHGVPEILTNPAKRGSTQAKIVELRETKSVKTLLVAYGDGINPHGMNIFDHLAFRGSCDANTLDEANNRTDCEPTIEAKTPTQLKTKLASKIRQILAERLAFTAPSITATIQEGGSLYQAQFAYEQYGEWQGTILRKEISGTGDVNLEHPDNWNAKDQIYTQAKNNTRNIWTALPVPEANETEEEKATRKTLSYLGSGWNNWNTSDENLLAIEDLFDRLSFDLTDYHNSTSECSVNTEGRTVTVGQDGTDDEIEGLINFTIGQDYFDYNGNCNITETRDHVLGDIYHSQLIEIGPPDGNTDFQNNNEEAYYRSLNNYQAFRSLQADRRNVLYAGSNSGILHAINAETGDEEWGFVPPFIAAKFPTMINAEYDGSLEGPSASESAGGSNAIFGVDGSPVVHDVFIKGLKPDGTPETEPSWHTLLFVPYGRGGSGFSVLDVTNPIVEPTIGPLHMFSVYNDMVNSKVYVMNYKGEIVQDEDGSEGFSYAQTQFNLEDSREAQRADLQFKNAEDNDEDLNSDLSDYTNRLAIDECKNDSDYPGKFKDEGLTSCYKGKVFNFDINLGADGTVFSLDTFNAYKIDGSGVKTDITYSSAKMVDGYLQIAFGEDYVYNTGRRNEDGSAEEASSNIFLTTSCGQTSGIPTHYDYSKMGETWSTPRIVRLPSPTSSSSLVTATGSVDVSQDKYVAIMGAGYSTNVCAGSALYLVEIGFDDPEKPGKIFGHEINQGPILIADTEPTDTESGDSVVIKGSDIGNAVQTNPVVITPDTAFDIPWRGALVYVNDREGKITKINLTDMDKEGVSMFDQTTLFTLNANSDNRRYTFFSMDAGVGLSTGHLWLFGGTGNFNALGERADLMDNIMYGVRDIHYPSFEHLNGVHIPLPNEGTDFMSKALEGALAARSIDESEDCVDVTGDRVKCPSSEDAWKVRLDTGVGENHSYRKVSAPPTLFKGEVYFPIYEPPAGANKCNIGNAYICVADDECGTNNTYKLTKGAVAEANDQACLFVREGVLSELVIFGDKLFANVAGPSEDKDTLYSILAAPGEVVGNSSGWRESGF